MARWSQSRDRPLPPQIKALVVATSLAILVQQCQAFHGRASRSMLRRASSSAASRCVLASRAANAGAAAPARPRRLTTVRHGSALSMVWEDDAEPRRRRRQVDRGFSSGAGTGGLVDRSFSGSGGADGYSNARREDGSGGRLGGDWADADSSRGGSIRQQRYSGGVDGSYRGGGSRDFGGGEQRGRGRGGRGWDQAVESRGEGRGGRRDGRRRGGYDRDFGQRESRGRGASGGWGEGRGRGGEGRGGRSSYGGRERERGRGGRSFGGRKSDFSGRDSTGRGGPGMGGGPSRAWTPESSGSGGGQWYVDGDDQVFGGQGGEEADEGFVGEDVEGWGPSRSSPASDWMRGELCERRGSGCSVSQ